MMKVEISSQVRVGVVDLVRLMNLTVCYKTTNLYHKAAGGLSEK